MSCLYYAFGMEHTKLIRYSLEVTEYLSQARAEYEEANVDLCRSFIHNLGPVTVPFSTARPIEHLFLSDDYLQSAIRVIDLMRTELARYRDPLKEKDVEVQSAVAAMVGKGILNSRDSRKIQEATENQGISQIFDDWTEGAQNLQEETRGLIDRLNKFAGFSKLFGSIVLVDQNLEGSISSQSLTLEFAWANMLASYNSSLVLSHEISLKRHGRRGLL